MAAMAVEPAPRRLTVEEYYQMARAGILRPEDRVELIEGRIFTATPMGSPHAGAVSWFTNVLPRRLEGKALVQIQCPIRLDDYSDPEPDVAVLKPRSDHYRSRHPGPEDVLLLIEAGETSADWDRRVKAPLYARFGIPEVWRVDLGREVIVAHRDPGPEGYHTLRTFRRGETLSPVLLPDLQLAADEILG